MITFFPIFSNKFVFYVESLTNIITYILKIITELLEYLLFSNILILIYGEARKNFRRIKI